MRTARAGIFWKKTAFTPVIRAIARGRLKTLNTFVNAALLTLFSLPIHFGGWIIILNLHGISPKRQRWWRPRQNSKFTSWSPQQCENISTVAKLRDHY